MQMQRPQSRGKPSIWQASARLFLAQIDGFVVVSGNSSANLRGRPAGLGLVVGVEAFLGTGGALGTMRIFKATVQAGVAELAITAAIARQLVNDAWNLGGQLVNVHLPGIAKVR